jgi:hypothetical protein
MKLYIFYVLTALFTAWMVLFIFGVSAGFASYIPIAALLGSLLLFLVAAPIFVFNVKIGLKTGLIGCLFLLPYNLMFVIGVISDGILNWGILLIFIPTFLMIVSTYLTAKLLLKKKFVISDKPSNKIIKIMLSGTPIVLFIIYFISTWKYWSWGFFKI